MSPPTSVSRAMTVPVLEVSFFRLRDRVLTGERQTTLVPEALSVSQDDMTIRPVIDCNQ